MFYPDSMVKKEEDPFGTFQPDCTFFNHCITNFYDQDSEQDIPQHNCTPQDVCHTRSRSCATSNMSSTSATLLSTTYSKQSTTTLLSKMWTLNSSKGKSLNRKTSLKDKEPKTGKRFFIRKEFQCMLRCSMSKKKSTKNKGTESVPKYPEIAKNKKSKLSNNSTGSFSKNVNSKKRKTKG